MQLVFATHNTNKLQEVEKLLPASISLLSLTAIGCNEDIAETGTTLEANARLKADHVANTYGMSCFADDTGLLVNSLNGAPGVYSARYAGTQKSAEDNMELLLRNLKDVSDRSAAFQTVIALRLKEELHTFKGVVKGEITLEKKGTKGFGYDPIFRPEGYTKTFAELPLSVKNEIGHRGKAIKALLEFLKTVG
ncbi:non-canonical purine NTP diphosphatase [Maribacter sp. 2-571]|uniref:non-canonical purine NTP diphosphatase n=1 Tax=Maribacter sp. 2-571 TaxID=3417569 RepID=UPI003D331588